MILISQDNEKIIKRILNFDNIICLQIDVLDTQNIVIVYNDVNTDANNLKNYNCVLGVYGSKERANEVLKEIYDKYKEFAINLNNEVISEVNYPKAYEMPRE